MDVPISCICPGSPHPDGDTVTLRDELDFRTAARVRNSIVLLDDAQREDVGLVLAVLQEAYLLYGIASWTLQDADGSPLDVTPANVTGSLLVHVAQASIVADAADDLYAEVVIAPLARRGAMLSQATLTAQPTSAQTTGSAPPTPLVRSKRSSTTATLTDATGAASA